uniref:CASP-like protein n=1 Tax=Kalanchoe fedtschenkoi TaxID=63787 RepID=A0A7N0VEM6_KALFE
MNVMSVAGPGGVVSGGEDAAKVGCFRTGETLVRLLPLGLCVAALVLMLKNSESNDYGSLSYSDLTAFR